MGRLSGSPVEVPCINDHWSARSKYEWNNDLYNNGDQSLLDILVKVSGMSISIEVPMLKEV